MKAKTKAPELTLEEIKYFKQLIENKTPLCVKMYDDEIVKGRLEYYDQGFIRLTRDGDSNLFIYKDDIKYLYEDAN